MEEMLCRFATQRVLEVVRLNKAGIIGSRISRTTNITYSHVNKILFSLETLKILMSIKSGRIRTWYPTKLGLDIMDLFARVHLLVDDASPESISL